MGVFDAIKLYASEWEETGCRKFSPEECGKVINCMVANSKWGKSVMFVFPEGKRYIPLEPTANVNAGDALDVTRIELVSLKYIGTDITRKDKVVLRVRVNPADFGEVVSFDNPFGL